MKTKLKVIAGILSVVFFIGMLHTHDFVYGIVSILLFMCMCTDIIIEEIKKIKP